MSQIGRCLGIQQLTQFLVVLCFIDSRISGTVDDAVNSVLRYIGLDGSLIGDVQLSDIRIKIGMLGIFLLQQLHLVTQLTVTACNQYIHYSNFNPSSLSFL